MPPSVDELYPLTIDIPSYTEEDLLVAQFSGYEAISEPFELTVDIRCKDARLKPDDFLRKPATVTVVNANPYLESRTFHGFIRRFSQGGRDQNFSWYRLEIVPAMWFLTMTTDCRIFQNLSVPAIVQKLFKEAGITDVKLALTGDYAPREYCVQYRETTFAFISRLLEEEGIYYFFEHEEKKHTIVLGDATSAIKPLSPAMIPLVMSDSAAQLEADYIFDFEIDAAVRPGKMTLVDYNDTQTKKLQGSSAAAESKPSAKKLDLYDYPGKFDAVAGGDRYAKLRLEAEEAIGRVARGVSSSRRLMIGRSFGVEDPYSGDYNNEKFQLISLTHQARNPVFGGEEEFHWETRFAATPATTVFRPLHQTPKSIVHGTQTAVVVGTSGEEIYVDKFGRVKVQFFWDRVGTNDEKSSCWVRVSSAWAGKGWGAMYIPRIGQEVVVDFLEGDPDRPIITGRVYNSEQTVPYALPANSTQSGIKSHSSKGGETANTNEFRFEDKKGSEEIYLHAEKDLNTIVLNDETWTVGGNRTTEIKKDEKKTVKEGDEVTTIAKGSRTVSVDTGDQKHIIKKGNVTTSVDMGNVEHTVKMGNVDHKVKMGNVTTKIDLGKDATEAMQSIEFKVGQSSVKIDQMGVTIKGMMIKIEGQVQTDIKGMMTSVKADAMLMVKGAITMIN